MIAPTLRSIATGALFAAGLSLVAAPAAQAAADKISISVTGPSEIGGKPVSQVIIGNMVAPGNCTDFWTSLPQQSSWTWTNSGSNAKPFGLLFNFKAAGTEQTALKCVVIDPTVMSGDAMVAVTLSQCNVQGDPNNPALQVSGASGGAGVSIRPSAGSDKPCS